jgi:hypothetical protein
MLFDIAVFQRSAAMGTVKTEETDPTLGIAKENQLFPQHFDRLRNIAEISRDANNQPVSAQPLSRGRARSDMRNFGESDFPGPSF